MTSWIKNITLLTLAGALFACSNPNPNSAGALVDKTGKHAAGWLELHWQVAANLKGTDPFGAAAAVAATATPCAQCHGTDLSGGISKVSCFSTQFGSGIQCHPDRIGHPANWSQAIQHGQLGAMAPAGVSTGFAYCARCHGSDLKGGTGKAVSCFSCHTTAPHAPAPWIGGNLSHATTGSTNAAVCAQCHTGGNNFGQVIVSTPAAASPAAPAPDCFNNTLCHGGNVNPPHQASAAYLQPANHGTDAAGNNPAHLELGLASCQACHADSTGRFRQHTNNMVSGCETCHKAFTAHPTPWLPGRSVSGATPSNPNTTSHALAKNHGGSDCTLCHGAALDGVGGKGNAPSCTTGNPISGISCHATSPVVNKDDCKSCHSAFVNNQPLTGAHAIHLGLPNVTCTACHSGGGADPVTRVGAALHADGFLNVSSAVYWGRNGGFRFSTNNLTCANVRCHGGQTTPAWSAAGSIDVNKDCLKCHQQGDAGITPQTPEFNSFYSGLYTGVSPAVPLHQFHLGLNYPLPGPARLIFCTDCHSMADNVHFAGLATAAFGSTPGTQPGDTIALPVGASYLKNPDGSFPGTCNNVSCHTLAPSNASWGK